MDSPADHIFHWNSASMALKQAMSELADTTGRSLKGLEGITLGAAYEMVHDFFGEENLPDFWKIWMEWNIALEEPPAEMGDL